MPDSSKLFSRRPGFSAGTLLLAVLAGFFGYYLANNLTKTMVDKTPVKRYFTVMRTEACITIPADSGSKLGNNQLADLTEEALRRVDQLMSPVGETSDIRALNQAGANVWVEVSPATWTVVMEALRWQRLSGGAFDPTIGPVKKLFKFTGEDAVSWPDPETLQAAKDLVGGDKVRFAREGMRLALAKDGMSIDLGAIAKGYGVDQAIEALLANGAANALVDVGGEVRSIGYKETEGETPVPWKGGIENPRGEGVIRLEDISGKALATSGDYNQFFKYDGKIYSHIIDPRQGLPLAENVVSVTVIHPEYCMMADALATTLSVLGKDEGRDFLEREALTPLANGVEAYMFVVDDDGELTQIHFQVDETGTLTEKQSTPYFQENGTQAADNAR